MKKSKYEKPVARNLDAVQPVQGSCLSGNIEYTVVGTCESGNAAVTPCIVGSVVMPPQQCFPGGSAAYSCIANGTQAG